MGYIARAGKAGGRAGGHFLDGMGLLNSCVNNGLIHTQLNTIAQMIGGREGNGTSISAGSTPCSLSPNDDYEATSDQEVAPSGAQILSLWQIFIERVNPFLRIVHIPSLQPLVVQALTGHAQLPPDAQALLSAVYLDRCFGFAGK